MIAIDNSELFDPISYTAAKVLEKRARDCNIPLCRELADQMGLNWRYQPWKKFFSRFIGEKYGSGIYLQIRYDAMTAALLPFGKGSILELAAGFSTRGLSEGRNREAYIESDLEKLTNRKETILAQWSKLDRPSNHILIPANVVNETQMRELGDVLKKLQLKLPIAIINEGLTMYLDQHQLTRLRDHVAMILRISPKGSAWLTSDFSERLIDTGFVQSSMTALLSRKVQRKLNYFETNDQVSNFLASGGLSCTVLPNIMDNHPNHVLRHFAENFRIHRIELKE